MTTSNSDQLTISVFGLIHLILMVFAVVVAVKCYPSNPIIAGFLAALFPEVALIYFAIRYYLIDDPQFCKELKFRKL